MRNMEMKFDTRRGRYERETLVYLDPNEKTASVWTNVPNDIRRLSRLCDNFPNHYKVKKVTYTSDGLVSDVTFTVTKKFVKFGKPRELTEKQKEHLASMHRKEE